MASVASQEISIQIQLILTKACLERKILVNIRIKHHINNTELIRLKADEMGDI
jgi:hypothetical protein